MKNKKEIILLIIVILITFSTFSFASLGVLYTWASDASQILNWERSVQIYSNPLNSGFTTNLNNSINNSVTEWSRAGISVSKTTNGMGAEIIAYGGTLAEIQIIRPDYQDSWAGLCVTDSSDKEYIGVYDIYGVPNTVNHYHYTTGAILEVYMREYTLSYDWHKYFMTMTHEIGHGLGFSGHYTSTGTVMYYQVNTTTTLTNTELDHLDQVY